MAAEVTNPAIRPARILLADDHDIVRRGLRALVEAAGHQVCAEASTGREAVTLAAKTAPHVAVLDISMPLLNGIDTAEQIRRAAPETRSVTPQSSRPSGAAHGSV